MHEFKVWAPFRKQMAVEVAGERHPMRGPDKEGMWRADVDAGPGTDYAFLIDNDPTPYPDPRGTRMASDVHGPSRIYDQKAFEWHDQHWQGSPLSGAVIYEMHVGTFTDGGTFDSAIERLDYLRELGITHVEPLPIATFPGDFGWGYDGVGLFAVQEAYGGPDGLKRFVDACHARMIAVVLDVVYNHFGPVGNYTGKFGPYLTTSHRTPWGDAVNFEEGGSDEVRRYFVDNAKMWLRDFHVDGLRLDAVHEFNDRSAVHFMEQLSAEVEVLSATLGRRLVLIAESDLNDPKLVRPREAGGYGMDAQWSDDFHHALFTVLHKGESGLGYYDDFGSLADLAKSLTRIFVYDGCFSKYRMRRHGRPVDKLSAHHFLGYIQNHDQIGNRAVGDRIEHIVGLPPAKVAAGLVLTAPFVPMLFQGEEFAASTPFQYFAHHNDPEMAKAVSEGRKRDFAAFGWKSEEIPDPESPETFQRSKLNWSEVHEGQHAEMLDWTKKLIRLRRSSPSLNDGDTGHLSVRFDEAKRWLSLQRGGVLVLANLGMEPVVLESPENFCLLLESVEGIKSSPGKVTLPPRSLAVLTCETE